MIDEFKVKAIVAELFGVEIEEVTDDKSLIDDFNADEYDYVTLHSRLNFRLNACLKPEQVEAISRIGELLELCLKKKIGIN